MLSFLRSRIVFVTLMGLVVAALVVRVALPADAEGLGLTRDLPRWSTDGEPVLAARVADAFPDGTAVAVVEEALRAEGFDIVSDDRGLTDSTSNRSRWASRFLGTNLVCGWHASISWQQRDGRVYEAEAAISQGCL